jgi:predicted naringenin-chalcone synthase
VKVIGAGFGRTGTMSLKVALEELGAGPCLHSLESLNHSEFPKGTSHWERLVRGEPIDWHEVLAGFGSTVDWLCARYYPDILDAWPEARVILSVREPEAWYESCNASLHATRGLVGSTGVAGSAPAILQAIDSAIWEDVFDGRFRERDYALEVFERHRRQVIERVPADRLLVYDIRDGWAPLCELLDVPEPDTPFPHLNGRSAFWSRFGVSPGFAGADVGGRDRLGANGRTHARARRDVAEGVGRGRASSAAGAGQAAAATPFCIAGLTVADPPTSLDQAEVLELLDLSHDEFAVGVFARCGVERRRLHLDSGLLANPLQGRTAEVEQQLMDDAVRAVEQLGVDTGEIGTIVSATLYSLGCPTIAHRLIEHFEMDPKTDKYHLVGVGCASAVPLVRLAGQALQSHPGKKALVIAAESMSGLLSQATAHDLRSKTVGSAIFGDGCAAMLLDGDKAASGPQVIASRVHQVPDTLDAVRLDIAPQDSYLGLIRELPDVAGAHLRPITDAFLADHNLTGHMVDHWMLHPGGRRIIECSQQALALSDDDVSISRHVLANRGNVGTPSIFYVLHETIARRRPRPGQHGLLVTIGPGVSVGLMLLRF